LFCSNLTVPKDMLCDLPRAILNTDSDKNIPGGRSHTL
jgi:hypothetical protein